MLVSKRQGGNIAYSWMQGWLSRGRVRAKLCDQKAFRFIYQPESSFLVIQCSTWVKHVLSNRTDGQLEKPFQVQQSSTSTLMNSPHARNQALSRIQPGHQCFATETTYSPLLQSQYQSRKLVGHEDETFETHRTSQTPFFQNIPQNYNTHPRQYWKTRNSYQSWPHASVSQTMPQAIMYDRLLCIGPNKLQQGTPCKWYVRGETNMRIGKRKRSICCEWPAINGHW